MCISTWSRGCYFSTNENCSNFFSNFEIVTPLISFSFWWNEFVTIYWYSITIIKISRVFEKRNVMEDSYGINKKEKNKKIGKRSVLRLQENLFSSNFFGNRSTQPRAELIRLFSRRTIKQWRFRRARLLPVSNYNTRMACLYRSINRLCCGSSRGATTSLMIIYRRVIER